MVVDQCIGDIVLQTHELNTCASLDQGVNDTGLQSQRQASRPQMIPTSFLSIYYIPLKAKIEPRDQRICVCVCEDLNHCKPVIEAGMEEYSGKCRWLWNCYERMSVKDARNAH